jgi:hypothetical protein
MNVELVLGYYFKLMKEKRNEINKDTFMFDFKNALCIFPFLFVFGLIVKTMIN